MASSLPQTHKAIVLISRDQPFQVQTLDVPQPTPGSAIIKILAASILSYAGEAFTGKRPYPFPTPLTPGYCAVGRVAAVGQDSTLLKQDQLVLIDPTVHSRDNPEDIFLLGLMSGYSDGSRKLMDGEWRNGTWAEYAKIPLENCYPLDEDKLLNQMNYSPETLTSLGRLIVPFGGLSDINLKSGETVIITPATGPFGSAAVQVALAMGARVLAMGRNTAALEHLVSISPPGRVVPIPLTSNAETDAAELAKHGPIDAYFDISPPAAIGGHYLKTCILALRREGRISLMGGFRDDVALPHSKIMHSNLTIKGTWMSSREQNQRIIKMIEDGILPLGEDQVQVKGRFALEQWKEALDSAANNAKPADVVVFVP